jgi:Fic family protein
VAKKPSLTKGSARAGRWITQNPGPAAYRAFVPAPLPPAPPLAFDGRLEQLLERAAVSIGRLDGIGRLLTNADEFLYSYVRKEAVLSSQIEGTQSSLADLLLHENAAAPGTPLADVQEVSNYVAAVNRGLEMLATLPLSLRVVREIHRVLVTGTRGEHKTPGEFRKSQNWIGGSNPSNAFFVPPPPHEVMPALDNLEKFIHSDVTSALLRTGLAHAQFETIHPFLDGNGRVGRMLITLMLVDAGCISRPWLYMSLHFKRNRDAYYGALQRVRTDGDWEGWLSFYLDGLAAVASEATAKIEALLTLFNKDRATIQGSRGGSIYQAAAAASNLAVFDHLRQRVMIAIPETATATGLSKPTVARALTDLATMGIAREVTGGVRNRLFAYDTYLKLLVRDE